MTTRVHHALPRHPIVSLEDHVSAGGGQGLRAARASDPDDVIDLVTAAGVRGRGGAGFPTGRKWRSLRDDRSAADHAFVVVNAAEGEPGTFKDRALLRTNPFLVLEGALIAAHCLDTSSIVVATKARYAPAVDAVRRAVAELDAAGWLGDVVVRLVEGPDHYLLGEETALLEVIEGEEPLPRQLPPYEYGLFTTAPQLGWSAGEDRSPGGPAEPANNPALVNNVETFAHAALVCRHGADWYRAMGTDRSPGPTIVTVSGDVRRPTVAEIELGAPLRSVIDELGGGVAPDRAVKAVLSGVANPVLPAEALAEATVSYEGLEAAGGGLGSAGFVVYDDRRNMVDVAYQVSRFLYVESCGQCTPCKTGTHAVTLGLEQLMTGLGSATEAQAAITRHLRSATDGARCYLPVQEQRVVASLLQRFPDDVARRLAGGEPADLAVPLPKLADLVGGRLVTDEAEVHKQPDWTYAETPVRLTTRT